MAFTKTQNITQIEHLMQQKFTSPKEAFDFYDTNKVFIFYLSVFIGVYNFLYALVIVYCLSLVFQND